ncbi:MAG: TetR-like C-terminal domain-containing protein [Oscillospiraceae bacterium]
MENRTVDRRVRRTKLQLRRALLQLLETRELRDISVMELAKLTDINRGTFYLHYKDVFDLYEQMESEIFDDLMAIVGKYSSQSLPSVLCDLLLDLFDFFSANSDLCMRLLRTGDAAFINKVLDCMKPTYKKDWRLLFGNLDEELYEYYYAFISAGCLGTLRSWFYGGMKESPADMAAMTANIMLGFHNNKSAV